MILVDVSFFILRPRESEGVSESMPRRTSVTVRPAPDGRDLGDIFSYGTVCTSLSLSIRYLHIFFLVGLPSSAKIPLVAPSSFLPRKRFVTI